MVSETLTAVVKTNFVDQAYPKCGMQTTGVPGYL